MVEPNKSQVPSVPGVLCFYPTERTANIRHIRTDYTPMWLKPAIIKKHYCVDSLLEGKAKRQTPELEQ